MMDVRAQTTTVTGTVTDPNGIPYAGAQMKAQLVTTAGSPVTGQPTVTVNNQGQCRSAGQGSAPCQLPFQGTQGPFTLNSTGTIPTGGVNLQDNALVTPASTQWLFSISLVPGVAPPLGFGPVSCTAQITITGATQDIGATLTAACPAISLVGSSSAGGSPALGNAGDLQMKNGATPKLIQSNVNDNGTRVAVGINAQFKGPNPYYDIVSYGGRALAFPLQNTTATCNSNTTVNLAGAIDFINGEGIVLSKCGPATALATPAAPSSATPHGILNGSTTLSYEIVAEDFGNGLTAASPAITITNAAATLGLNTITLTSYATAQTGVTTFTTPAAHNIEAGYTKVLISGTTNTGGFPFAPNGTNYVQTTPTGTTFTTQGQPNASQGTGGTIQVPAVVWLKWTTQNNVMRWWIYKQVGGVGNYNLVGVAVGKEPFWVDAGYAAPTAPSHIPLTAPASAQNQALATSIVSGAGSTTLTVADAASVSSAGNLAQHDNSVALRAAYTAALNARGGTVRIPQTTNGSSFSFLYPAVIPGPANNGTIRMEVAGNLNFSQPFVPSNYLHMVGISSSNNGTPSFAQSNYGAVQGGGYPTIFVTGSALSFENLNIGSFGPQARTVLVQNATSVYMKNVYISAAANTGPGSIALTTRDVAFDYAFQNMVLSANAATSANFWDSPVWSIEAGTSGSPAGMLSFATARNLTLIGNGIVISGEALYPGNVANGMARDVFTDIYTESMSGPVFDMRNVTSSNWGRIELMNFALADQLVNTCQGIDFSSPNIGLNTASLYIGKANGGGTSGQCLLLNSGANANVFYESGSASDVNVLAGTGKSLIGANGGSTLNNQTYDSNGGFRVTGAGTVFAQLSPPSPTTIAVAAGGSVPIGTHYYAVSSLDWDGRESIVAFFQASATTSGGNQTVQLAWTRPSPAPQGYYVYRDGVRNQCALVTSTSYNDTLAVNCGQSGPGNVGLAGGSALGTNGVRSYQYLITNSTNEQGKHTVTSAATAARTVSVPDASGNMALDTTFGSNAYDNFNRANGAIGTGAPVTWTQSAGTLNVSSNTIVGATLNVQSMAVVTSPVYQADQFAEVTIANISNSEAPVVRGSSVTNSGYTCFATTTGHNLGKLTAGSFASFASDANVPVVGDTIRCESQGTALRMYSNSTLILSTTDSTFSTGSPGVVIFSNSSAALDNFTAGNINSAFYSPLHSENDWSAPQHVPTLTVGATNPIAGTLTPGALYAQNFIANAVPGGVSGALSEGYDATTKTGQYNSNNGGASSYTGAWNCTNVTPVTVSANVATDQNLMACTVPAGTLNRVGRSLRVFVAGVYSTEVANASTITIKAKLCTVSGCGSGTVITPQSITSGANATGVTTLPFNSDLLSTTQTAGASAAFEAHGKLAIDLTAVAAADSVYDDGNTATVGTIDSTAQLFLQITGTFSVAGAAAGNIFTQRQLVVETIN